MLTLPFIWGVFYTHTHTHTSDFCIIRYRVLATYWPEGVSWETIKGNLFFCERGILSTSGIIRSASSIYWQIWHRMFREWWIDAYTGLIHVISTGDTLKDLLHFFVAVGSQYVPHLQGIPEILVNLTSSNICWWYVRYLCTVKFL